jgi:hypothetical protein
MVVRGEIFIREVNRPLHGVVRYLLDGMYSEFLPPKHNFILHLTTTKRELRIDANGPDYRLSAMSSIRYLKPSAS